MIIVIIILSFYLEGMLSNFILTDSLLVPIFTMLSLLLVYPFYRKNNLGFSVSAGVLGALYDITYTNTIFLNMMIFVLLSLVIMKIYDYINDNLFDTIFISLLLICLYRVLTYLFLVVIGYLSFDILVLAQSIYSSIIINIIYVIIVYIIASFAGRRLKIQRMD